MSQSLVCLATQPNGTSKPNSPSNGETGRRGWGGGRQTDRQTDRQRHLFVDWCDNSYLDLNVTKTKEMSAYFRRQEHSPGKTIIHNNEVEIVSKYKYLGTIFDDKLKRDDNTEENSTERATAAVSLAKAELFIC